MFGTRIEHTKSDVLNIDKNLMFTPGHNQQKDCPPPTPSYTFETDSSFLDGFQSAKCYPTGLEAMHGVIIRVISALGTPQARQRLEKE